MGGAQAPGPRSTLDVGAGHIRLLAEPVVPLRVPLAPEALCAPPVAADDALAIPGPCGLVHFDCVGRLAPWAAARLPRFPWALQAVLASHCFLLHTPPSPHLPARNRKLAPPAPHPRTIGQDKPSPHLPPINSYPPSGRICLEIPYSPLACFARPAPDQRNRFANKSLRLFHPDGLRGSPTHSLSSVGPQ